MKELSQNELAIISGASNLAKDMAKGAAAGASAGAVGGAAAGAIFGPPGAGAGALRGAVSGAIGGAIKPVFEAGINSFPKNAFPLPVQIPIFPMNPSWVTQRPR